MYSLKLINDSSSYAGIFLQEVLGYNLQQSLDIEHSLPFTMAINLTLEQVKLIMQPFINHDIRVQIIDEDTEKTVMCKDIGIVKCEIKRPYYDSPIIGMDNQAIESPIHYDPSSVAPKCPKCGSSTVVTGRKGFSVMTGFIGSGATMNRCGRCGHKWKPRR